MEIINENYILIVFEFAEGNKASVNNFRCILMGNVEEINNFRDKFIVHNFPMDINKDFIKNIKSKYKEQLDDGKNFLFPIDFSIIKRIVHTFEVSGRVRYTNKPVGIMALFKYMGPLTYIKDFLKLMENRLNNMRKEERNVFHNITNLKLILGSELKYTEEIINQNFFLFIFEFNDSSADPNDFRRTLLGLQRTIKKKMIDGNTKKVQVDVKPNIPKFINKYYLSKIEKKYDEKLDSKTDYIYPIDFAIIKRPVVYETDSGDTRRSDFAAGVILLYKYMGPMTYVNDFKETIELTFTALRSGDKKEMHLKTLKNPYFKKANEPLIIIGAELKYFKGFN